MNSTIKLCRLCLKESENSLDLFNNDSKIVKEIKDFLGIEIDNKIPDCVCDGCVSFIHCFVEFYKTARINQDVYLKRRKTELSNIKNAEEMGEKQLRQSSQNTRKSKLAQKKVTNKPELNTEINTTTRNPIDVELPVHLKTRINKEVGNAKIREFVKLSCAMCPEDTDFLTFELLQDHYMKAHNCRGFIQCCDKKFNRKDRLMNHIINHTNPEAFKCPHCNQKSKSKLLLKIHMKQHLPVEDRQYHCETCGQRFVLRSQLKNHEASHLPDEEKRFVCDECGKAFALNFAMLKHKQTHLEERNFICEICAKSFVSESNMRAHKANHTSEPKPRVQCNICNAWYKNMDTLRTHKRRHRDNREYICPTCNKRCTTKSSLSAHIRYVHLKIEGFECNLCSKKFRRKLELKEHLSRHTGQALYQCSFCPKSFISSSNYFVHRKTRHRAELETKMQWPDADSNSALAQDEIVLNVVLDNGVLTSYEIVNEDKITKSI